MFHTYVSVQWKRSSDENSVFLPKPTLPEKHVKHNTYGPDTTQNPITAKTI